MSDFPSNSGDEKIPVPTWVESEVKDGVVEHTVTFDDKTTRTYIEDDEDGDTEKVEVTDG